MDAMNNDDLLTQLQVMSGGSLVMTTEQLAKSLSMNPKVISRMRREGRFPIAHKSIGSKIVYSIVSVAHYLLSDEPESLVTTNQNGRSRSAGIPTSELRGKAKQPRTENLALRGSN